MKKIFTKRLSLIYPVLICLLSTMDAVAASVDQEILNVIQQPTIPEDMKIEITPMVSHPEVVKLEYNPVVGQITVYKQLLVAVDENSNLIQGDKAVWTDPADVQIEVFDVQQNNNVFKEKIKILNPNLFIGGNIAPSSFVFPAVEVTRTLQGEIIDARRTAAVEILGFTTVSSNYVQYPGFYFLQKEVGLNEEWQDETGTPDNTWRVKVLSFVQVGSHRCVEIEENSKSKTKVTAEDADGVKSEIGICREQIGKHYFDYENHLFVARDITTSIFLEGNHPGIPKANAPGRKYIRQIWKMVE